MPLSNGPVDPNPQLPFGHTDSVTPNVNIGFLDSFCLFGEVTVDISEADITENCLTNFS